MHLAIVCLRSDVLAATCRHSFKVLILVHTCEPRSATAQETSDGVISLPYDEPSVVDMMIQYFYRLDYRHSPDIHHPSQLSENEAFDCLHQPSNESQDENIRSSGLLLHAKVYTLAERYIAGGLKGLALKKFKTCLRGSVIYVGSPLQLTWADLWGKQRGVILLDPETLEHELIANPYAVGYTPADVKEVLRDAADPAMVRGKHVMLLGNPTPFTYTAARDQLVSLGTRGVKNWWPMAPMFHGTVESRGLDASMPASDSSLQQPNFATDNEMDEV